MKEKLLEFIDKLRRERKIDSFDEAAVKQVVVLKILSILGWDIFDRDEVMPEYASGRERVDYALRVNGQSKVFMEVKRGSEDLESHQKQLLNYSFAEGINLAILTNGATWWFYLTLQEGNWAQRKFYTIDILQQQPESIASKLISFLSRDNIASGQALRNAEQIYQGRQREEILRKSIPKAWKKILTEPEELFIELMIETTEKICGFRPEIDDIKQFLDKIPISVPPAPPPKPVKPKKQRRPPEVKKITQDELIPYVIKVLATHGGRCRKEQVQLEIYRILRSTFVTSWWEEQVSHGVPRWKHQIAWAKQRAKQRGLIKGPDESGRGCWELTQKGWEYFNREI